MHFETILNHAESNNRIELLYFVLMKKLMKSYDCREPLEFLKKKLSSTKKAQ